VSGSEDHARHGEIKRWQEFDMAAVRESRRERRDSGK